LFGDLYTHVHNNHNNCEKNAEFTLDLAKSSDKRIATIGDFLVNLSNALNP